MQTDKILSALAKPFVLSGLYKDEKVALTDIALNYVIRKMLDRVDLSKIIDHLKSLEIVSSTQIIFLDESLQRSICKLRSSLLPSRYKLDVRLIQTKTEIIYSCLYFRSRSQRCLTDWMITLPQP